ATTITGGDSVRRAPSDGWDEGGAAHGGVVLGLLQLLARVSEDPTGDDEQLDLLGALEDVEDLAVPGPLLEQLGLGVARGAGQLDAGEGDVHAGAPRLRLGHRGLHGVRLAVVGLPRRPQG